MTPIAHIDILKSLLIEAQEGQHLADAEALEAAIAALSAPQVFKDGEDFYWHACALLSVGVLRDSWDDLPSHWRKLWNAAAELIRAPRPESLDTAQEIGDGEALFKAADKKAFPGTTPSDFSKLSPGERMIWHAAAALKRIPRPEPATDWQPIETAPRDGKPLLVMDHNEDWFKAVWTERFCTFVLAENREMHVVNLTHWFRPALPEPPKPKQKTPGQVAYEAKWPTNRAAWLVLSKEERESYEAAAQAVLDHANAQKP